MDFDDFKYQLIHLVPEPGIAELRGVMNVPQNTPLEAWDVVNAKLTDVKSVRELYNELPYADKLWAIARWKASYMLALYQELKRTECES